MRRFIFLKHIILWGIFLYFLRFLKIRVIEILTSLLSSNTWWKIIHKSELSFTDFVALMKQSGWTKDHQKGSHQIWRSKKGYRISVQNRKGKAKRYQVKQFLSVLDEE